MRGSIFDDLIARLPPGLAAEAPDLPGHAGAAHLPATLDACAEVLRQRLAAGPALVVGWSMGAAAAWRHVARHGTAGMAGLMTIDMAPKIVPGPGWPHGLKGQTAASVAATTRRFATDWHGAAESIAATMFATPAGAPGFTRADALRQVLSNDPAQMRALWADLVAMDERATVPAVDVPWLVCRGGQSRVYPASAADWLVATAPDARLHVFEGSGHSPHLEEPAAFADVLARFAAEVWRAR